MSGISNWLKRYWTAAKQGEGCWLECHTLCDTTLENHFATPNDRNEAMY